MSEAVTKAPAAPAAPILRRRREPLSPDAVEAVARMSVISDFNRNTDCKRVHQAVQFSNYQKGIYGVGGSDDSRIASFFYAYFRNVSLSARKCVQELKMGDLQYVSPSILPKIGERWGVATINPKLFTPNIIQAATDKSPTSGVRSSTPFTLVTEKLPLGERPIHMSTLVKNAPARLTVEHRYTASTAGLQETATYVITGIGCFTTFLSGYFGFYHNRMLFAATPLLALVSYRGFRSLEVVQERSKHATQAFNARSAK